MRDYYIIGKKTFIILLVAAAALVGFVIAESQGGLHMVRPFVDSVTMSAPDVKAYDITPIVDAKTNTIQTFIIKLRNFSDKGATGRVYVIIYNASNEQIAYGEQLSVIIQPKDINVVSVNMRWAGTGSIDDMTTIKIGVSPEGLA